jgi:hypothetical protein
VQVQAGMQLEEAFHQFGFMRREVVQDDENLLPGRLGRDDFFQEANELLTGVPRGGLADDLAGFWIQGGLQRERPVPVVFEAVLFGPPW